MVDFLSVTTVIGQVLVLVLAGTWLYSRLSGQKNSKIKNFIETYGLWLMLLSAIMATGGSLYLSEIRLWTPCKLCWFQRIFVYPQVPLLLIALWKKDKNIATYILFLCLLGMFFSVYHYIEQIMATFFPAVVDPNEPCDLTGVSCAKTYTFRFGYITIPMMAFTSLLINFVTSLFLLKKRTSK